MRTKKNLDYYLNFPYNIIVTPILLEEGGGYMIHCLSLERWGL